MRSRRSYRTHQDRGVENVRLETLVEHQTPRRPRLLLTLSGEPDVGPAGEQVLLVPGRLAVAEENQPIAHSQYLTIEAKLSGSREAPPTRAPSMSPFAMKSLMLPALTEPP